MITFLVDQEHSSGIYLFQNQVGLTAQGWLLWTLQQGEVTFAKRISKFLLSLAIEVDKIGFIIYLNNITTKLLMINNIV